MQDFHLDILGLQIAGIKTGNPHGPTIIALHGWLDNCLSFKPLTPFLQDFNLIAVDFTGHGLSAHRSPDCYLHFIDYVNDLGFILKQLNLNEVFLLGHSLGGSIATLFAGLFPEHVKGIVVIDTLGPIVAEATEQLLMFQRAGKKYWDLNNKNLKVFASIHEAMQARAKASPMSTHALELLVKRNLKSVGNGFSWRTDPRLLISPNTAPSEENIQTFLKAIRCPVGLIIPDNGYDYGKDFFTKRQACIDNLETHHLPGGHHIHMDSPEIVGPLVNRFFTRYS